MTLYAPNALVESRDIGERVRIGEFALVRKGAVIGDDVVIGPHCIVESGVSIGDRTELFPGTYLGKPPRGAKALHRKPVYEEVVTIGEDCVLGPYAVIYYDVVVGAGSLICDMVSIREGCRIGNRCLIARGVKINSKVHVGAYVQILDQTLISTLTHIEDRVFIGPSVTTASDKTMGKEGYDEADVRGPRICHHAMLAAGVIVNAGVVIGWHSMIGAGAVVTRDIPPSMIAFGVPARVVGPVDERLGRKQT